jgi:hypothetical protein
MDGSNEISKLRVQAAWAVAVGADFLQIIAFPFFAEGAASPLDDALDILVAGTLTVLIGWHWSFIPSFLAKLVPVFDLVPTWSAAMLLAHPKTAKLSASGKNPLAADGQVAGAASQGEEGRHLAGESARARAEREADGEKPITHRR